MERLLGGIKTPRWAAQHAVTWVVAAACAEQACGQANASDAQDTMERSTVPGGSEYADGTWLVPDPMSGDWGGLRTALAGNGLSFDISYSADFFFNFSGGLNTSDANQYRGLLDVSMTLDTEKMGLWEDGSFFVQMIENHGRDISERHVGDLQAQNNNDAENFVRLYQFYYEHVFLDGALRLKFVKLDANEDFAASDYAGEFVHSSSGFSPTIPFPTWPDPALGVVLFVEPVEWAYAGAGVYDALGSGRRGGFETAFHAPDESIAMFELGVRPRLSVFGRDGLPGNWRFGAFYDTRQYERIDTEDSVIRGSWGLYVVVDQMLYREPQQPAEAEAGQGLGLFLQFGYAPSQVNEISQHYGGGLAYTGLLPNREADICGVSLQHVNLSRYVQVLEDRHSETAIELFYKWQLTESLSIKPDLQIIINPGGSGRDSIVGGVRIELSL